MKKIAIATLSILMVLVLTTPVLGSSEVEIYKEVSENEQIEKLIEYYL